SSSRSPGPIGRVSVVMYGETGTGGTPGQAREGDAAAALATATGTSADSHAPAALSSGARREVTAGTEAAIRTRSSRGSSPTRVYEIPPMFQCTSVPVRCGAMVPMTDPMRTCRPRGGGPRRREQPRGEDRVELHLEERRRLLEGPVRAVALESKNEALRRIHPEPQGGPAWTLALDVEHEGPAPRHLVGGTDAHVVVVP